MAKNKREKGENSGSNKGVGILIGVLIVITWLSVMCLLIKCDVGGFGSRVLRPVFKDVPVINKYCRMLRMRKLRLRVIIHIRIWRML